MKLYCGIDLHSTNSVIVVVDEEGREVLKKRRRNELDAVLGTLDAVRDRLESVAVESTYNWYWLVDGLMDAGYEVRLANPAAMKQYQGLKYSDDESDARWLAEMQRLGVLPTGYIYPKEERPVRDLLRRRGKLVRARTAQVLGIQNLMSRNTGKGASTKNIQSWTDEEIADLFDDADLVLPIAATVHVIRALNEAIREIEKRVLARARLKPEFKMLLTVNGIGEVLAMTIMLETGDIHRFKRVGNYASYCRCVDSKRVSNGKKKGSGNAKNGNAHLAWAYYEAATYAVRYEPTIQRFHQRKRSKSGLNVVATNAVAHKLARACYHMLRRQEPFEVTRAFG